jgi:hypothetical protein
MQLPVAVYAARRRDLSPAADTEATIAKQHKLLKGSSNGHARSRNASAKLKGTRRL